MPRIPRFITAFAVALLVAMSILSVPVLPAQAAPVTSCTLCAQFKAITSFVLPSQAAQLLAPAFNAFGALPVDDTAHSNPVTQGAYDQAVAGLPPIGSQVAYHIPLDGSSVAVALHDGRNTLKLSGLYNYDINLGPDLLADAMCSLPSPLWRDMVDYGEDLNTTPINRHNPWHAGRYGYGFYVADGPMSAHYIVPPTDAVLQVYIDGRETPWTPTQRTPTDEQGRTNDYACNNVDHTYEVPLTLVQGVPTRIVNLSIFDLYYGDNVAVGDGLTATVTYLGGSTLLDP